MSGKGTVLLNSNSPKRKDFEWSLKPITIWMTILGQEMVFDSGKVKHKSFSFRSVAIWSLGFIILSVNVVINSISIVTVLKKYLVTNKDGIPGFLSLFISHISHDLLVVCIPLTFTFIRLFTYRWKDVLSFIKVIQCDMNLSEEFHRRLRKDVFIAIFLFLFDEAVWLYRSTRSSYWRDLPNISNPLSIALGNLCYIAASSIQTTLYVFICASILVFQELRKRMNEICCKIPVDEAALLSTVLDRWRHHHDLACSLVEKINRCFGCCLLFTIISSNMTFVKYTCQAINGYQSPDVKPDSIRSYILQVVVVFFRLIVVLWVSQKLKFEGEMISKCVIKIHSSEIIQMQAQTGILGLQVSQTSPKINAMDFMDYELAIIPSLLGTTLAYTIVLYQAFHQTNILLVVKNLNG